MDYIILLSKQRQIKMPISEIILIAVNAIFALALATTYRKGGYYGQDNKNID